MRTSFRSKLDAATLRGQAAHLRRLAAVLSDGYMVRAVSELSAAYENQAVRIQTGVPPEQSSKDSEEGRGVSCQAAIRKSQTLADRIIH